MKELICIVCPKGCHLVIDVENDYAVTGHGCAKGIDYGRDELINPTRVVTSTVRCTGALHPRCPVKTDAAIPKAKIFEVMEALDKIDLEAPIQCGQVVIANVCGTEANIVATRTL